MAKDDILEGAWTKVRDDIYICAAGGKVDLNLTNSGCGKDHTAVLAPADAEYLATFLRAHSRAALKQEANPRPATVVYPPPRPGAPPEAAPEPPKAAVPPASPSAPPPAPEPPRKTYMVASGLVNADGSVEGPSNGIFD